MNSNVLNFYIMIKYIKLHKYICLINNNKLKTLLFIIIIFIDKNKFKL